MPRMPRSPSSSVSTRTASAILRLASVMLASGAMAACAVDAPTASGVNPRVSLAKAPPPSVTVTSTDPAYGFQGDSVLTVRVKGTGFTAGARTSWQINGDTTHVHEIGTPTFVSSTEVVTTIKVDLDAPVALYDVVVTLVGGKKGVGSEVFTVKSVNERQQLPIPIAVTIDDVGPAGPSRIRSDGLDEYVDGQQGMQAIIDQFGNLQITPQNGGTTPADRSVVFDFTVPADPLNTYRPNVSGQINFKILTIDYDNPRIQDLGVGQSACYRATFAFRNLTTHHQANFSAAYDPQASYALITRTSASMWTMVTDGSCGAHPTWALVKSQDLTRKNAPLVSRGNYSLPFSIHFRAL
jgi:hypothetical protein